MSTISLRLPESLHDAARNLAKQDGVSTNQFIATALAEKVAALMAEDYLAERARRGDRRKFEAVLAKVPDVEPEEHDKL
jgi:hypothetical protein